MLRAAFGVLPKKRSREASEETITPDTSSPPALPSPTCAPASGIEIGADQQAQDHPEREREQVGRGAGPRDLARERRELVDRALRARHEQHVHALQLEVQAERDRHAAALDVVHRELSREVRGAQLGQLHALERLVGDEDLGLVERDRRAPTPPLLPARSGPCSR